MNGRAALLSVSNTTGLEPLAKALTELGYTLLTTTGTGAFLDKAGIKSLAIEEYTKQPEILGGRVKTLHPKIHAGILAKRDTPQDLEDLKNSNALPIDVVVVTLYPFRDKIKQGADKDLTYRKLIELVDIGGATLLRAAAKNAEFVLVVSDPSDYGNCAKALSEAKFVEKLPLEFRLSRAVSALSILADDTVTISKTLSRRVEGEKPREGIVLEEVQPLRYGENPHQKAGFFRMVGDNAPLPWKQLQGKELSYNNLIDLDSSFNLIRPFLKKEPTAVIIKHTNPCGVGRGTSVLAAIQAAKKCDPRSHFGGIIVTNNEFPLDAAEEVAAEFAEIVVAPSFSKEALERLQRNKNLRVIEASLDTPMPAIEFKQAAFGVLVQERDNGTTLEDAEIVSKRAPTSQEKAELEFAWSVCSGVKSNSIVLAKEGMVIGVGAGQMSRIDSVEIALRKAELHKHNIKGSVAASDAFFPFPDSVQTLAASGVTAIVAPGGAKRDPEVIAAANEAGVALMFAKNRHFRH